MLYCITIWMVLIKRSAAFELQGLQSTAAVGHNIHSLEQNVIIAHHVQVLPPALPPAEISGKKINYL